MTDVLPGWNHQPRARKKHCPLCDKPRVVVVQVVARQRESGQQGLGGQLGSASVGLCNTHALELFGLLRDEVEKRR